MPYTNTKSLTATATDGTEITLVVPSEGLPSQDRAEYLRGLYREHVRHPETPANPNGNWKGRAECVVPAAIADDVAEAMDFVGSIVDYRGANALGTKVVLMSHGYWAHGF